MPDYECEMADRTGFTSETRAGGSSLDSEVGVERANVGQRFAALFECAEAPGVQRTRFQRMICYIKRLSDAYGTHQCSLMACACAYCAILSVVPLLVVGVAALGYFLGGSDNALQQVLTASRRYAPVDPAFIKETLLHVLQDRKLIGVFGIVGLIYGAHQTFLAMQPAMNIIWVAPETRHWLRQRFVAVIATFITLILLGADLTATTCIALISQYNSTFLPGLTEARLLRLALNISPMLLTTILFATLYQILPARAVPIRAALVGAAVAALFWQLLKVGFAYSLVYVHTYDRLYGSLSGVVILVVWIYYSMAILLLGAEIAADYEFTRHGRKEAQDRSHSGADLSAAKGIPHLFPIAENKNNIQNYAPGEASEQSQAPVNGEQEEKRSGKLPENQAQNQAESAETVVPPQYVSSEPTVELPQQTAAQQSPGTDSAPPDV